MRWLAFLLGAQAGELSSSERAALERGEIVLRQETARGGSEGSSSVLVEATAQEVWSVIEDFDAYVEFLPYVTASSLLEGPEELGEGRFRWQMELTAKGLVTRYVTDAHRDGEVMTWEMRPDGSSPMKRSTGSWRVSEWDDRRVLLTYTAQADTAWWIPVFVHRKAADAGLPVMVRLVAERAVQSKGG